MHTNQFFSKNDEKQPISSNFKKGIEQGSCGRTAILSVKTRNSQKTLRQRERENPTSQRRTQNLDFERPQNNSAKSKNKQQQQHALRYRKPPKKKLIKKNPQSIEQKGEKNRQQENNNNNSNKKQTSKQAISSPVTG